MGAGAGFNALASAGVQAGLDKIQRKRDAADEERRGKAEPLLADTRNLQAEISSYKDGNGNIIPQYQAQHDKAVDALTKTQQAWDELYHPVKAPGAAAQDMHWIIDKFKNITAPKDKTPASTTSQAPETTLNTPASPITTPALPAYQQSSPVVTSQGTPKPLLITQSFADKPAPKMTSQGNVDLSKTLNIDNGDGTHSSTFSMSFGTDKGEVLVPGVGDGKTYPARQLRVLYTLPDGSQKWAVPGNQPHNWIAPERPTPQNNEALNQYQKTGKNFGTFEDEKAADAYGKTLHEDQEKYGNNGVTANPVSRLGNVTTTQPGESATTLPAMQSAPVALPAGPSTTVTKAPPVPWGQAQVLKQKAASMQKAQGEANLLAAGAPLSPEQEAMAQFRAKDATRQVEIDASLRLAEKLGITGPALDEFKQQLVGIKNTTIKPLTGAAGQPYIGPDGLYRQAVSNPDGTVGFRQMPPDWKPNTKAIAGTIINTKQHGWIKTWLDPYNPSKVIGFQKITPGRQYTGTQSSSTATDAAGVTTSTSRSTMPTNTTPVDMDFSGTPELPESYNGEEIPASPTSVGQPFPASTPSGSPNKSPAPLATAPRSVAKPVTAGTATPAQLKSQVPAPPPQSVPTSGGHLEADENGHIPESALGLDGKTINPQIREAANQLLDGVAMKDVTIAGKDKPVAEAVARKYGWGQGPYLPRELKQMQNADQFLDQALNSKAFMRAIDEGTFRRTATALAQKDSSKEGVLGTIAHQIAQGTLNKDQKEYLNIRQALMGTVSGLSSVVRTGRPTEATINRLAQEIPDVMSSSDSTQAKEKIAQIKKELKVALAQGVPAPASKVQHKIGDWVMYNGNKVKIKSIDKDGSFEY